MSVRGVQSKRTQTESAVRAMEKNSINTSTNNSLLHNHKKTRHVDNNATVFYTIISSTNGIQNYARPFEDILHSYDATSTNDDSLCLGSTPTKDTLT